MRKELAQIREQQGKSKEARAGVTKQIDELDAKLKKQIESQKEARKRVEFRSVDEIDQRINRLQKDVDAGTMKIVDEKKALAEISNLNRIKRNFGGFEDADKSITELKAKISELKKGRDDPESKALSDRYNEITKQLDEIKASSDAAYQNRNSLKDEQNKAYEDRQTKFAAVKAHKDAYYEGIRNAKSYEREAAKARAQKRAQEQAAWEAGKRKEVAQRKLEEASAPAYQTDIYTAESILRFFDPSSVEAKQTAAPSKYAATNIRGAENKNDAFKGMKAFKRDEDQEEYFVGGGGKKKGGRKQKTTEPNIQLTARLIEDLSLMGIDPPMSSADTPAVVEKVKAKLTFWKENQAKKTEENIAAAKKEIEKLEAESAQGDGSNDHAKKVAQKHAGVNGKVDADAELEQEKDAVKDVTKEMEEAKIEDAE